jgi:hypothetical protein
MSKLHKYAFSFALLSAVTLSAEEGNKFNAFTGKVIGKHVRLRVGADLESQIVREMGKNDLIVVTGENGEFYQVEPLSDMKAYIFRSFVLDNVVEGNRVNVRLFPDLESPVISHLHTGTRIDGVICEEHTKWLEINPPSDTRFFVAKEFIEFAGNPELKVTMDKRLASVNQMMESAKLLTQAEMCKPFEEIDRERVISGFDQIVENYTDFPLYTESAKEHLSAFTESFLQKKIAYLEKKTAQLSKQVIQEELVDLADAGEMNMNATDRMRAWEHVEESLYLAWSAMHHAKSMNDFYTDQKLSSNVVSGILETYPEPVKNKPGDFVIKEKDVPVAYVYSTHVNLHHLIGKRVNLFVSPRPNNSFAFPAYYVLDAE